MIPRRKTGFVKNALFISHTSLSDFLKCPKAYYLKNVYRDPKQDYRLQIASPYISLGATVHDLAKWYLENSDSPSLLDANDQFRNFWWKYHGKRGGFADTAEEAAFGARGLKMIENFLKNAGKLPKAVPIPAFPKYPLAEDVILLGNLDYVGELPDGSLQVIDFKTGSHDEKDPMQLYIYAILAENFYGKPVSKASYWYLDRDDLPKEIVLDPLEGRLEWLREKGLMVKQAITENNWQCCKEDLCRECRDYTDIIEGKGEFMFSDHAYKKEVYYLSRDH